MENKTKKVFSFALMGIFALAMVSAMLVTTFSQKEINLSVESPIILSGDLVESTELVAGEGYKLYLVEGENKLNESIDVNVRFNLINGEGNELADSTGFYLAYSEDLSYAYSEEYGDVDNFDDAKVWMFDNLDWFDWYLTNDLSNYDSSVITNHGGNSAFVGLAYNTNIPVELSPGEFQAVVYLDIDSAVVPGDYQLNVELLPQ